MDVSMTRPVLAILLVGTLINMCAASLTATDDETTRNLLIGGLVSLSSAVVAFYFSSSHATEARRDLLMAMTGLGTVPYLVGKTVGEAQALISGRTDLAAEFIDGPAPDKSAEIVTQDPPANRQCGAERGRTSIMVRVKSPTQP